MRLGVRLDILGRGRQGAPFKKRKSPSGEKESGWIGVIEAAVSAFQETVELQHLSGDGANQRNIVLTLRRDVVRARGGVCNRTAFRALHLLDVGRDSQSKFWRHRENMAFCPE
ncbi:hypothetical protein AVEN_59732-1 [Araneus ventricosus]|uniref:Uncharacterized protein n=1 Tax=Araneus ventricosus TaxID=182803 RepID=A0A4Y2BPM0_ARAVE|nr:hypothetical protein AVEN_59732-1 [Araneus ventricosus]